MRWRILLACVSVTALGWLALQADEPAKKTATQAADQIKADLALQEQNLGSRFKEFELSVLKLMQVLEKSDKDGDKEKAALLARALEESKALGISAKFDQLVEAINNKKFVKPGDVADILADSKNLADKIKQIMVILQEDSRSLKLRQERENLEQLLKKLEKVIHDQKIVQLKTERGTATPKDQDEVTQATKKIAEAMNNKGSPGKEAKDNKGTAKEGGKNANKSGESKELGKTGEAKNAQSKDGGKPGDPKDAKPGEAKPGDPKAGDPKSGDPKDAKPGEAKPGKGADPKGGDSKPGKGGDPKAGDAKPGQQGGEAKPPAQAKDGGKEDKTGGIKEKAKAEAKGGPAKEAKPNDPKQGETKPGPKGGDPKQSGAKESKPGDSKPGDSKPGDAKPGDAKPGEAKPGQKSDGKGEAKPGQQSPQAKENKDPKAAPPPPPSANQPKQDIGKKQIEDAEYPQNEAAKKIAKKDPKAADDQEDAKKLLEAAKKKLEQLLNQIREEELERLLADLQRRCIKMRDMQIVVLQGTDRVHKEILGLPDKLATNIQKQAAIKLSDDGEIGEKAIVAEADRTIQLLEAEGSAVAFPEVFKQVREDMAHVQRRLYITDVGKFTQNMEKDIIATLEEMIEALAKAKKDLDKKKADPKPPGDPKASQPQDQKLLEKIAELKMIKSMQIRVNQRTKEYAQEYTGEQANEPRIQQELHGLSQRQFRIFEVTNRIAKGDNK